MRIFTSIALSTLLSTLTLQAGAKDTTPASSAVVPVEKSSGFYIGGGIGSFALHNTDADEYLKAKAATLIAGYRFNQYVSLEGRYTQSTKLHYSKGGKSKDLESIYTNTALFAKLSAPIGSFTPYALLGYGQNKITNFIGSDRIERSIEYGAGVSLKATENLSLFADYIRAYSKRASMAELLQNISRSISSQQDSYTNSKEIS